MTKVDPVLAGLTSEKSLSLHHGLLGERKFQVLQYRILVVVQQASPPPESSMGSGRIS